MQEPTQILIPEPLRIQLADFQRFLWRIKIIEAIAAGMIGLAASYLLVYGLDRIIPTPSWLRLIILITGVSLFALFAPYWLHRWIWGQRKEQQLAQLIAKRFPGLGDRLLGVIELQNQNGNADTLSPRLREAAMLAVAAETQQRSLTDALPPQHHRLWGLIALILITATSAILITTPHAGRNALQRWLLPLSNTQRYTFTKITPTPKYLAVPIGEAFDIHIQLAQDSEQSPAFAKARFAQQPEIQTSLANQSYHFTFPGQQNPGIISFQIGDALHDLKIEPLPRPAVEQIQATITYPEYLKLSPLTTQLKFGSLNTVEGSSIQIELQLNRPLTAASYGPITEIQLDQTTPSPTKNLTTQSNLTIHGSTAVSPVIPVGSQPFEIPFAWRDHLGLKSNTDFLLRVDAAKDAAPSCYLQNTERQYIILPEETIHFEVLAEDDYGIKSCGIEWSGQFTQPTDDAPAMGELPLSENPKSLRQLLVPAQFSPAAFQISPQKITLRGWTDDQFPSRTRSYSEPIVIYVLTRNEHAQYLKNRFDRVISELEDISRRELNLLEENQRIDRLDGKSLQTEESKKRLESQQEEESETKRRTDALTEQMEQLMKDTIRNGDIDKATLKKMASSLQAFQEMSQQDVPKLQQKLNDANQASNTPENAKKEMNQAVQEQEALVQKMQNAAEQASDANRSFEAGTFISRLKKAASEQANITSNLKKSFSNGILGLFRKNVDPNNEKVLKSTEKQQTDTASDVRWIQEDLTHYFSRTKNETFKEILDVMQASNIDLELDQIRTALNKNFSYESAESSLYWSQELEQWAQKLEAKNKEAGGGGGGGGGSSEDEDVEFMLRVMKMIQTQQDIRAQTRSLEQLRRNQQKIQHPKISES